MKISNLAIKFFPDQEYVSYFFDNYKVAFSAPSVFNDCFESYLLPSNKNGQIDIDLQVLMQSPQSALCFCCSKLEGLQDLNKSEFELMWSHYASEHRGIGVIFNRENAFSYLKEKQEEAFDSDNDTTKYTSAKYEYNYTGFDVKYLSLENNDYGSNNFFQSKESVTVYNNLFDLIHNGQEKTNIRKKVDWQKLFAKNSIWQYESEYRYVIQKHTDFKKVGELDKYLVPMKEDSIQGVVFANRFQENDSFAKAIITKILQSDKEKKLSYYHLRKSTTKKQLEAIDISSIINSSIVFYQKNTDQLGQITDDILRFFREQNYNFFKSTGDQENAFQKLASDINPKVAQVCLSLQKQQGNCQNINHNFENIADSIPQSKVTEILNDKSLDDYPLRFFRILNDIDEENKLSYEVKERNKRILKNFGIELRYNEQINSWTTEIVKVQE
ncbi:DUF2971 domain-containing protein [Francisella salimarina]|uniref:DUF2971 domain-containing protein n=1 Tax=Francisella salimarina TaxID=2599927 RepID=UPI003D813A6E